MLKISQSRSHPASQHIMIHTCVLCTRIRIHICRDSVLSGFFGPSKCLVLTPGFTSSTPCAVCVCASHTPTHTTTYTPTHVKNRKAQDNTCISLSFKNHPPRQATSALHELAEPPHPRLPTRMNKLRTQERMCTPCSDCVADMDGDIKNICKMYTPACTGAQDTCLMHTTLIA